MRWEKVFKTNLGNISQTLAQHYTKQGNPTKLRNKLVKRRHNVTIKLQRRRKKFVNFSLVTQPAKVTTTLSHVYIHRYCIKYNVLRGVSSSRVSDIH